MNGYSYADMVGKTGKNLTVTLDGKRLVFRGEPAVPAVLRVNDEEATLSTVVHAGDHIHFIPASHGQPAARTLGELLGENFYGKAMVNNAIAPMDRPLAQGDVVLTLRQTPPALAAQAAGPVQPEAPAYRPPAQTRPRQVHLLSLIHI